MSPPIRRWRLVAAEGEEAIPEDPKHHPEACQGAEVPLPEVVPEVPQAEDTHEHKEEAAPPQEEAVERGDPAAGVQEGIAHGAAARAAKVEKPIPAARIPW